MSMMPISANDLYQSYAAAWPFASFNRHLYHSNEKYHSTTNQRITRFFIDDILADSKTSNNSEICPCPSKIRKG